jgi:hypothetical protein
VAIRGFRNPFITALAVFERMFFIPKDLSLTTAAESVESGESVKVFIKVKGELDKI